MRLSLRLMIWFLMVLPFRAFYGISTFIYLIMFYILGYRREVVRKNLTNAFPEKSRAELKQIEKAFYRHLADYLVETVAIFHMNENDFDSRYKLVNIEILHEYSKRGINVILAPGHYGNWEWITHMGLKIHFTSIAIYKKQSNKFVDDLILRSRAKYGLLLLQYHETYRFLLSADASSPVCLLFLGDQRPREVAKVSWIKFMNQETAAFRGLENLHLKMKGIVLYVNIKKVRRGYYEVNFRPLNQPGEIDLKPDLTTRYFQALEKDIKEDPRYYLWSHNRWKYSPPADLSVTNEKNV
ncbi:MAG: hypothetical protein V1733_01925 [bacterium]